MVHVRLLVSRTSEIRFDLLRRLRHSHAGQSLVEMSLVLPLVFTLFFGVFEMGRHFYTRIGVRHVVAEAARFAVTGNVLLDENGDPLDRPSSIQKVMAEGANRFNIRVDSIYMTPSDGGGPEDVVQVAMIYTYEFSMPGMHRFFPDMSFTVQTAMRNEPYFD